jgi:hypothetical protein
MTTMDIELAVWFGFVPVVFLGMLAMVVTRTLSSGERS